MAATLIACMLVVIGVIHLLPLAGVISVERLTLLYGVVVTDANVAVLLRHRAVLFGLLGGLFVYSAYAPSYQPLALVLAFVSIASFFFFAFTAGVDSQGWMALSSQLQQVVRVDVIASVCWLVAVGAYVCQERAN